MKYQIPQYRYGRRNLISEKLNGEMEYSLMEN